MESSLNNDEIYENKCCNTKCKLAFSVLGTITGFIAFGLFGFKFHNWNAASWALLSCITTLCVTLILVQDLRGRWRANHHQLKYFMLAGCFVLLTGLTGFITYLVLAIYQHQGLDPYGDGYYVTMVWCFMTTKSGFGIFFNSRGFRRRYLIKICDVNT